ncbi:MAG TPA: Hsp70 family protein [Bryobacteraceae bacterium]|nr:Hsp70 family protein [Bryobacteraceae bacterium]
MSYVIGIDLGTTNFALSCIDRDIPGVDPLAPPSVEQFSIPQLVNPGEVRDETLLPSFLFIPGPSDFPAGSLALPWNETPVSFAGSLAQKRGAENAGRLVASAKSWLSYGGVDRTAALLPAAAPDGVGRISPVAASRAYLEHLRDAWNLRHADAPLDQQTVLVTVPASFDAVARELTQHAAEQAGYRNVVLLEEPQAAFYSWIQANPRWRDQVGVGDLILVVDIGGGTTDFTLIAVTEEGGELRLERVAVGEHFLLGGDNMDLALAHGVAAQLQGKGTKLDSMQLNALWQQCRVAKERLLDPTYEATEHGVAILGRGTGLVGGTIKSSVSREMLHATLLDGFFPSAGSGDMPQQRRRAALQELGLPYASDPAVTRHLARFLRQQASAAESGSVRRGPSGLASPTHVLFNGGVLRAGLVRDRILDVLNGWLAEEGFGPVRTLSGEDLMHAVSRGAAYYGLAREGRGVRIRGGVPRTYYVGIESSVPAVPGFPAPLKALTVVPFGMEEGTDLQFSEREFGLIVGEPAEFRFFTSATRKTDNPGNMLEEVTEELEELAPVEVTLHADGQQGQTVRVTLEATVTETGMLQLWCVAKDGRRWKLEFNVRERVEA